MNLHVEHRMSAGLVDEARDHRDYVDVLANFQVIAANRVLHGLTLSRTSVTVKSAANHEQDGNPLDTEAGITDSGDFPCTLRIALSGFVLEIALTARLDQDAMLHQEVLRLRISHISEKNQIALNRVIRALMAGILPTIDDIVRNQDAETRLARKEGSGQAASPRHRARWVVGLACAVIVGIVSYGALAIYSATQVIKPVHAALTAPKLDLFSKINGTVASVEAPYQASVVRDQVLYRLDSRDIDADIQASRAKLAYYQALDKEYQQQATGTAAPTDAALAASSQARYSRDLEQGLLVSLELKKAALVNYSPCDCKIVWVIDEGASVRAGDRVMTLAKTGAGEIRVEALVEQARAALIHPGQEAAVSIPGQDAAFDAQVEMVSSDGDLPPRYGFPEKLRKNADLATVVLRVNDLPPGIALGLPVEVVIRK